jgi:hypothetical protein
MIGTGQSIRSAISHGEASGCGTRSASAVTVPHSGHADPEAIPSRE